MVMQKDGRVMRDLTVIGSALLVVLALIGAAYNVSVKVNSIDGKLDRNCRVLAAIQADARFLILEHSGSARGEFRQIFRNAAIESCG